MGKKGNGGGSKSLVQALNYVTANRFYVSIETQNGFSACFTECSGLSAKRKYEPYFQGGMNNAQVLVLGQMQFSEVTLKRGVTNDPSFLNWAIADPPVAATSFVITVFNQAGETMQTWTLTNVVPTGWQGPSLQADATTVAIEELTVAYEALTLN